MTLVYKQRLYPNMEQEWKLLRTKEVCRCTYNRFLELYNKGEHDCLTLQALLPVWKETDADLKEVYAKVLQYVLYQLFSNLSAIREMKKRGRKVGRLRFKSEHRFKTFTYNQSGFKLLPKNEKYGFLHLSKIGDIPIRLHREIVGEIKQVTIKQFPSGKWYANIVVDNGSNDIEPVDIESAVGIDVGLEHYVLDSDGNEVDNPRHLKQALKKLRREQRRLSRKEKNSKNREKQRIKVARQYEKVCNQRNDFQHKLSHNYVDNHYLIVTEKLQPSTMVKDHLARSISDASWSSLNQNSLTKLRMLVSCSFRWIQGVRARNARAAVNSFSNLLAIDGTTVRIVDCLYRVTITLRSISSIED